jgi:hypothetical protein
VAILGTMREGMSQGWGKKKLNNDELNNLYRSVDHNRKIKSRRWDAENT